MRPVIIDYNSLDPNLPRIFKDRFDHFVKVLYLISSNDGDREVITPTFRYLKEQWMNLYEQQGKTQHLSAQNWLFGARQVSQAVKEFTRGAGQYYDSWTRRVARGHEFCYNHEAITDLILGEAGSRTFRIKPEDLKGLLEPHSLSQHEVLKEWMIGWSPDLYLTVHDEPIKWRNDVGAWL